MKYNVGGVDRMVRAVLGVAMLAAGGYYHSAWGFAGLVPLFTAVTAWCPLYLPFGLSTFSRAQNGCCSKGAA